MTISMREYARRRGVALSAVQKAVASGRIRKEPDGGIDPAKADAQWAQKTRPAQATTQVTTAKVVGGHSAGGQVVGGHADDSESQSGTRSSSGGGEETRGVDYHKARAVRETYAARLAKLDYDERTGKLLNADEVRVAQFNMYRRTRDRLQQIPRKVAPEIVALVVANPDIRGVTDILDAAIREALEELSR